MMEPGGVTGPHATAKRVRRRPEEAEREILEATERLLHSRDFRDLTVDDVMSGTGMQRSAFYNYFADRNALALRLLERVEGEMHEVSRPWLTTPGASRQALRDGLDGIVQIYARNGHVLRAIHEASYHDHVVEREYRGRVIDGFIDVVAQRLREIGRERGAPFPNARDTAHALLMMNVAVMVDRLGRAPADRPAAVARSLVLVWEQTIYGGPEAGVDP
jgi:AcrR family transcriptional regulator